MRPADLPETFFHGTRSRYVIGCRCKPCTVANRLVRRERLARANALALELPARPPPSLPPVVIEKRSSGGVVMKFAFKHPCPGPPGAPCAVGACVRKDSPGGLCGTCRASLLWNGLVDVGPVVEHLRMLSKLGVGYKSVAAACDVGKSTLQGVISGVKLKIRKKTADRVLSVTGGALADHALIDGRPAQKLIRKLLREGFTKIEIARRLGSKAKVPQLQIKNRITAKTGLKVRRLHSELTAIDEGVDALSICLDCGFSHDRENRLAALRRALPAEPDELRELRPCWWGHGDRGERQLLRDLRALGAVKLGAAPGAIGGTWQLKKEEA